MVTVKLIVVFCPRAPDVPITVTETVPVAADAVALKVNVLVFVVLVGLKDAVTPLGRVDVIARFTLLLKPPDGLTVIVLVMLAPWARVTELGEAKTVKLGLTLLLELPPPHAAKARRLGNVTDLKNKRSLEFRTGHPMEKLLKEHD